MSPIVILGRNLLGTESLSQSKPGAGRERHTGWAWQNYRRRGLSKSREHRHLRNPDPVSQRSEAGEKISSPGFGPSAQDFI